MFGLPGVHSGQFQRSNAITSWFSDDYLITLLKKTHKHLMPGLDRADEAASALLPRWPSSGTPNNPA